MSRQAAWGVFGALLLIVCVVLVGHTRVTQIAVSKTRWAVQTDSTGPHMQSDNPWGFTAVLEVTGLSDLSGLPILECPAGSSRETIALVPEGLSYRLDERFGTQVAMDSAFASGTYAFLFTGQSQQALSRVGLRLVGAYPPFPALFGGTWENGKLLFDPLEPLYLRWSVPDDQDLQVIFSLETGDGNAPIDPVFGKSDFSSYVVPHGQLPPQGGYILIDIFRLVDFHSPGLVLGGGAHFQSVTRIELAPKK